MENLIAAINTINFDYLIICLVALFYSLERIIGTPFKFDKRLNHFVQNFLIQIPFYFANLAFAAFQVLSISWFSTHQIGLFYWVEIPLWLQVIIGVMALDFTSYWFHRMAHKSPLLWRLHRVHHSDTSMDASTFLRGHALEVMVFGTANIIACIVFGLDIQILGVYFVILLPFLAAQHANIVLPGWTDRWLGKIFITPNFHKVHHEQNQYYTDSNYADIFVFWDKLFGTFKYKPVQSLRYGLAEFDDEKSQTFWYQLISPFIQIDRITQDKP